MVLFAEVYHAILKARRTECDRCQKGTNCFGAQQEQRRWPKDFVLTWRIRSIHGPTYRSMQVSLCLQKGEGAWMRCTQRDGQRKAGGESEKVYSGLDRCNQKRLRDFKTSFAAEF